MSPTYATKGLTAQLSNLLVGILRCGIFVCPVVGRKKIILIHVSSLSTIFVYTSTISSQNNHPDFIAMFIDAGDWPRTQKLAIIVLPLFSRALFCVASEHVRSAHQEGEVSKNLPQLGTKIAARLQGSLANLFLAVAP